MKYLIFDSGTIINFSMNGMLSILEELKKIFRGRFLITEPIKYEIIEHPAKINKFKFGALQIKKLLDNKVIELAENLVDRKKLQQKTKEILDISNHTFFSENKPIHIIDWGEASSIALTKILDGEKIIVVDERTTRVLCEKPENLRKLLQKKLHSKIEAKKQNFAHFQNIKIIRSTELAYIAYKKGFINLKNGNVLEALLYAFKFKGCSISDKEIREISNK